MIININGQQASVTSDGKNLGQVLTEADELTERGGQIIVSIRLDSRPVGADELPVLAGMDCTGIGVLDLETKPLRFMRLEAIEIFLGILDALKAGVDTDKIASISGDLSDFASRYAGLFSAEENSFIENILHQLRPGQTPEKKLPQQVIEKTALFMQERRQEALDPAVAMNNTARLFESVKPELDQVSVRLQTGKEQEAMRTMVLVIEIINKTVRILPDYIGTLPEVFQIGDQSVQDFYENFNSVLRELMEAFEHKDSVLIGDLAEYEILPRMSAFFAALPAHTDEVAT